MALVGSPAAERPSASARLQHIACIAAAAQALLLAALSGLAPAASAAPPGTGPGGPILVITDSADPFGSYYAEILTAEGLNAYQVRDIDQVTQTTLDASSVAIVAARELTGAQDSMLSSWVAGGGNLIAMRPTAELADLLGLGSDTGTLDDAYLEVDSTSGRGTGITDASMQFHGRADLWTAPGTARIADLYTNSTTTAGAPALTMRNVGAAGGQAAAFTYDLARSVVQTRQGNPAWAGQKRDGTTEPIGSTDLFFPDWIDFAKIRVPQADEQQRLLANLITQMSMDRLPMPRFWYFPRGEKAVVVMTGDDHTSNGTVSHFERFLALSPSGCSVADWECVRSTSYIYDGENPMTDSQAESYQDRGFEIALHLWTGCSDWTESQLRDRWLGPQLSVFRSKWPSLSSPRTNRTHCVAWSDWATKPKVELDHGIRLDTNYYYYPSGWVQNRPGMFTGSGIPMRFAGLDGTPIDVYQATTQITDESGMDIPAHIAALLDGAVGSQGYYGVFTANIHTDRAVAPAVSIVEAAQARGVPVVSASQLLSWLDGRNGSSFQGLSYDGRRLSFSIDRASGARGLEAMIPAASAAGELVGLTRDGAPVAVSSRTVKGMGYRAFEAAPGDYVGTYSANASPVPTTPQPGWTPGAPATTRDGVKARRRSKAEPGPPGRATPRKRPKGPRVRVGPRRPRSSSRGWVTLRVGCPKTAGACRVDLRLRRRGRTLAQDRVSLAGGRSELVSVRLRRSARRRLADRDSLRAVVQVRATDLAGSRSYRTMRVRLLAPEEVTRAKTRRP